MGRLAGKVAIITGAARGQGAVEAELFVKEGAKVVLTDVLVEEGKNLAEKLGENAIFLEHDVSSSDAWKTVAAKAKEHFGKIDVLVNNAGIAGKESPLEDTLEENFMKIINVNQLSVFLGMKYVAPYMKEQGSGSIVNISSLAGLGCYPGNISYTASKWAVRGMTKAAAVELAASGIRVNSVHPGYIDTEMIRAEGTDGLTEAGPSIVPMQRYGDAIEAAKMVLFLASDDSSYSTGSEFTLDGGIHAQ